MTDNPLVALARCAADWRFRELSPAVDRDTRRAILDWFAATMAGCGEGPAVALASALASERDTGRAVCYVDGRYGSARQAALLNGTLSHVAEFDDIYRDGGYHPGSPTIAAALAVAQDRNASYETMRRAVIAGYEVGCRIATALQPSHYRNWHITGTVGTFGAATATALLLDGDADTIAHALALASSFAGGHQENLQGAGQAKALHPGHAADAGVLAGLAAAAGITGSLDSLHAAQGYAAATSETTGNWEGGLEGLGAWTPISRITVKNYGCCGHIFATLDGLRELQRTHGFAVGDIRSIAVASYGATLAICDRMMVESARDARFSLQYCVAALLCIGNVRQTAFTAAALRRRDIRQAMNLVSLCEDAALTAGYPQRRSARIAVVLTDGLRLEHYQHTRKGDPDDPISDAELYEKYDELAAEVLDRDAAERLKRRIMHGDDLIGQLA